MLDDHSTIGLRFYIRHLFERSGAPRASPRLLHPIDIHGASSAIWVLRDSAGSIIRRRRACESRTEHGPWRTCNARMGASRSSCIRRYRNSVSYIRWNDAHMLLALASFLDRPGADESQRV